MSKGTRQLVCLVSVSAADWSFSPGQSVPEGSLRWQVDPEEATRLIEAGVFGLAAGEAIEVTTVEAAPERAVAPRKRAARKKRDE